jgi:hypothetical protein
MKACHPPPPSHPLHPELNALIDRGLLTRAEAADVSALVVEIGHAVARAVSRGEMTLDQAGALGRLLGVAYAQNTNDRRLRRSN